MNVRKTVKAEDLQELKASLDEIFTDAGRHVAERRKVGAEVRFCLWEGQSEDGRKHSKAFGGKAVFPFEGASDVRMRLADMVVNENVALLVAAAVRGTVQVVQGVESTDAAQAELVRALLRWMLLGKMGRRYWREVVKAAQYREGDCPGCAIVATGWRQEWGMEYRTLGIEELVMRLGEARPNATQRDATDLVNALANPESEESAAVMISALIPDAVEKQLPGIVRQLREAGKAEYAARYLCRNEPVVEALRLFRDVFVPPNTTELADAEAIHRRVLLSPDRVKAMEEDEGWSKDFIKAVIEKKGETFRAESEEGFADIVEGNRHVAPESAKGKCEIFYSYRKQADENGVPGVFVTVWSAVAQMAAKDAELLDYWDGEYPFVEFSREVLNDRLWDSRGVPEVLSSDQYQLKQQDDTFCDHTSVATLPPVRVPRNRPRMEMVIGPLVQVKENRPGETGFWDVPEYPRASEAYVARVNRRVNEYFGRPGEGIDPELVILKRQMMVDGFMSSLSDVVRKVVCLGFQFLPDETLQRIAGEAGERTPMPRGRRDVQQGFDVMMSSNVRNLSMEYVTKIAEVIGTQLLTVDTMSTVQRDQLTQVLFEMIDPFIASRVLQPVEQASQKEADDEELNFVKIRAGIEPPMMEQGQNFALRAQVLQGILQKNPAALKGMDETSKAILQKRLEHLTFMQQQAQNAQTGRVGATPALGQ